jgi:hypothetical protein
MTYAEQREDPRWQKKRLEILNRSRFSCEDCGDVKKTLHVHHRYYVAHRMPWEYPDFCYQVLCKDCHDLIKENTEYNRSEGDSMFEDWEIGLDHFGVNIIDVASESSQGRLSHNFARDKDP